MIGMIGMIFNLFKKDNLMHGDEHYQDGRQDPSLRFALILSIVAFVSCVLLIKIFEWLL